MGSQESNEGPKITIIYDGIYANRLNWRTDNLCEFADAADLRTYTFISAGDDRNEPQVHMEKRTDIIALKQSLFMPNLFDRSPQKGKGSEAIDDLDSGEAYIVLNHEILIDKLKEKYDGRATPDLYADLLDQEVKSSLMKILWAEKWFQFRLTGRIVGGHALGMVGFPILFHYLAEWSPYLIDFNETDALALNMNFLLSWPNITTRIMEYTAGPVGLLGGYIKLQRAKEEMKEYPSIYFSSLSDLNPMKYPTDLLKGYSYLKKSGLRVVGLNKS